MQHVRLFFHGALNQPRTYQVTKPRPSTPECHHKTGKDDVRYGQWQEKLPAECHELVIAEAGERSANPDIKKDEENDFRHKPEDRRYHLPQRRSGRYEPLERTMPSTQEQQGRKASDRNHVAIL